MNILMRFAVVILGLIIFLPSFASAGSLDAPAAPTVKESAMFTLDDIFKRLGSSTTVTKRSGGFTEPSAAPASTGHTLDEVMTLVNSRARGGKTGQTDCYKEDGTTGTIACTGSTGQDGDLEKGVTWPNPRFTDNGDGTVTDNLTTLIWLDNANCAGAIRNWATALNDVDSLNSAGTMNSNSCGDTSNSESNQTDWRLPSIKELQSLIHFGFSNPAVPNAEGTAKWVNDDPFVSGSVQSDWYWSSTTVVSGTSNAWVVFLLNGTVSNGSKTGTLFVWPVRGGQ